MAQFFFSFFRILIFLFEYLVELGTFADHVSNRGWAAAYQIAFERRCFEYQKPIDFGNVAATILLFSPKPSTSQQLH